VPCTKRRSINLDWQFSPERSSELLAQGRFAQCKQKKIGDYGKLLHPKASKRQPRNHLTNRGTEQFPLCAAESSFLCRTKTSNLHNKLCAQNKGMGEPFGGSLLKSSTRIRGRIRWKGRPCSRLENNPLQKRTAGGAGRHGRMADCKKRT